MKTFIISELKWNLLQNSFPSVLIGINSFRYTYINGLYIARKIKISKTKFFWYTKGGFICGLNWWILEWNGPKISDGCLNSVFIGPRTGFTGAKRIMARPHHSVTLLCPPHPPWRGLFGGIFTETNKIF